VWRFPSASVHVGRTVDGRQVFLTTPFVPAVGGIPGREFIALFLVDRLCRFIDRREAEGAHLDAFPADVVHRAGGNPAAPAGGPITGSTRKSAQHAGKEGGGRTNNAGQSIPDYTPPQTTGQAIRYRLHTSIAKKAAYRSLSLEVVLWEGQIIACSCGTRRTRHIKINEEQMVLQMSESAPREHTKARALPKKCCPAAVFPDRNPRVRSAQPKTFGYGSTLARRLHSSDRSNG
jgi:hypothetical protein